MTGVEKYGDFSRTLSLLCNQSNVPFEVRTTIHTALMNEEDIGAIIRDLDERAYRGTYYIQNFRADNDRPTLKVLPAQKRSLEIQVLPTPKNFLIGYRNF